MVTRQKLISALSGSQAAVRELIEEELGTHCVGFFFFGQN